MALLEPPYEKQPGEVVKLWVNFAKRVIVGESLTARTVTSIDRSDNTDSTSTIISASGISGNKVYVLVQGGDDGEIHKVTVEVDTSGGQTLEDDFNLIIREV